MGSVCKLELPVPDDVRGLPYVTAHSSAVKLLDDGSNWRFIVALHLTTGDQKFKTLFLQTPSENVDGF